MSTKQGGSIFTTPPFFLPSLYYYHYQATLLVRHKLVINAASPTTSYVLTLANPTHNAAVALVTLLEPVLVAIKGMWRDPLYDVKKGLLEEAYHEVFQVVDASCRLYECPSIEPVIHICQLIPVYAPRILLTIIGLYMLVSLWYVHLLRSSQSTIYT